MPNSKFIFASRLLGPHCMSCLHRHRSRMSRVDVSTFSTGHTRVTVSETGHTTVDLKFDNASLTNRHQ